MREKIQQLNYTTWFMPSVSILSGGFPFEAYTTSTKSNTIQFGDVLHVDFGVTAMGLNTDTQHLGYVLRPGETEKDIPQGLVDGLKNANRVQDIVVSNMKAGLLGNDILKKSLQDMENEGITGKIYCHPIGDWGHSAGTLFGTSTLSHDLIETDVKLLRHDQSSKWCTDSRRFTAVGSYVLQYRVVC